MWTPLFSGIAELIDLVLRRQFCLAVAAAGEGCALCLAAAAGITSFYADFSCMTFAVIVVRAVCGFAVDRAGWRCFACHVAVGITFAFFKAVTAGFFGTFCGISSYNDSIQVTVEILVVCTCLYGTS